MFNMLSAFNGDDGRIDYRALATSAEFARFKKSLSALEWLQLAELTREQLMAFAFNLYNALVIHAAIEIGSPLAAHGGKASQDDAAAVAARAQFFASASYKIGDKVFSLDGACACAEIHTLFCHYAYVTIKAIPVSMASVVPKRITFTLLLFSKLN